MKCYTERKRWVKKCRIKRKMLRKRLMFSVNILYSCKATKKEIPADEAGGRQGADRMRTRTSAAQLFLSASVNIIYSAPALQSTLTSPIFQCIHTFYGIQKFSIRMHISWHRMSMVLGSHPARIYYTRHERGEPATFGPSLRLISQRHLFNIVSHFLQLLLACSSRLKRSKCI